MPVPQPPRSTRRELLKMLPVAGAAVLLQPTWRSRVIERGLALNDVISERTFDPRLAAPTYADSEVTPFDRFPLNSYLADDPDIDLDEWRLEISGLVARPGRYSVRDLRALPRVRQNTRHICIEGWDVIGSFGGIRLGDVLTLVGADQRARFVEVRCGDDVRVCHWTFALSLLVLIGSGLEVFAAFPSFGEKLPASDLPVPPSILRIGGWLGGALQWHFTFAWLLDCDGDLLHVSGCERQCPPGAVRAS
jgi:DMSO/TMAO reductase YedYZ molybdopterin-dependent catalytic subunit